MTQALLLLLLAAHVLAAVYWVGGMAFAYLVLRPAAGELEITANGVLTSCATPAASMFIKCQKMAL